MKISKYLTGGKGVGSQDPNCDNYRTFFSTLTPSLMNIFRNQNLFKSIRFDLVHSINLLFKIKLFGYEEKSVTI